MSEKINVLINRPNRSSALTCAGVNVGQKKRRLAISTMMGLACGEVTTAIAGGQQTSKLEEDC